MVRAIFVRGVVPFCVALVLSLGAPAHAGDKPEGSGIVAPSEYLEDIETPGDSGGVMDEVDSAQAQAEAAEAAKKAAEEKKPAEEDAGGW